MITDIVMPEKEGLETIGALQRERPDVKIVAVSGEGRIGPQGYLHMAKVLGAHHTFSKPFDWSEMLNAARELTDRGKEHA